MEAGIMATLRNNIRQRDQLVFWGRIISCFVFMNQNYESLVLTIHWSMKLIFFKTCIHEI